MYKESEKPTGSDYLKNNFNGKEAEEEKKKVQEIEKEKLKLQEEVDKFKLISAELEAAKSKVSELTKGKGELETTASKKQSLEKDNADLKNMVKELKIENGKLKSELKEKETSSAVSSSTTPIPSKDKDEPMDTNNQAEKVGVKEDKSEEPKVSEDKDSATSSSDKFNGFSNGSEVTASKDTEAKKIKNDGTDAIKKEDFRKYLENEGILDSVTGKLIGLYKEVDKNEAITSTDSQDST